MKVWSRRVGNAEQEAVVQEVTAQDAVMQEAVQEVTVQETIGQEAIEEQAAVAVPLTSESKRHGRWILGLSFAIPFLIMLVIFILKEIYPFGDRSFLFSDMYHQYMPFFTEFMRKIRAGEGLAYSYNVGIGSNFLALYVYYLASPLHWLALLVPEAHIMEFMSYLAMVKIALCGLTSCIYLRKHFGAGKDVGVLFFSTFYALSGFMAAYNWNIMWLDCVVLLPLIVLGLEQLVKEGRCTLYCVMLALSILTNFYISIMICIFLVLYFLVLLLTEKRSFKVWQQFFWCLRSARFWRQTLAIWIFLKNWNLTLVYLICWQGTACVSLRREDWITGPIFTAVP